MKRFKIIALITAVLLSLNMVAFAAQGDDEYEYLKKVQEFIQTNYRFELTKEQLLDNAIKQMLKDKPELLESAIKGLSKGLDNYSVYMDSSEYRSLAQELSGVFTGIGVRIEMQNQYVVVIEPIENSPAQKAGIIKGDKIVRVDGNDVRGKDVSEVKAAVIGKEGTSVKVAVERDGVTGEISFDIIRAQIKTASVFSKIEDNNIGYIRISSFTNTCDQEVKEVLDAFDKKGIRKIILDLRYNPGGNKDAAVKICEYFVPKGPIMNVTYKDSTKNTTDYSNNPVAKYKVAVLANGYSASASELVSGALQDRKVGVVIGERTFGKGTVQTIQGLATGGAIKLTIATYTTANNNPVNGVGIKPDYEIKNDKLILSEDSRYEKFQFAGEINDKSDGKQILAIEQRLTAAGYYVGQKPDEKFDNNTIAAIKKYQKDNKIDETGILDINTQIALDNATYNLQTIVDNQLAKAKSYLENLK